MPSNTLKQSSKSFSQVEFLPEKAHLMVLVRPSGDVAKKLLSLLHTNLNTLAGKKENFVEVILQENLL